MNGPVTETQWYIARDGKQHGPLTDIEMRTFVAHNYLRASDLIWRAGMAEWQPAPSVFPAVFPQQPSAPEQEPQPETQSVPGDDAAEITSDFDAVEEDEAPQPKSIGRKLATAAVVLAVLGGGAFAVATYQEPLIALVSGSKPAKDDGNGTSQASTTPPVIAAPTESSSDTQTAVADAGSASSDAASAPATAPAEASAPSTTPGETQTAALTPSQPSAPPPAVDGSDIDSRLQKIPVWTLLKSQYHDWYETTVGEALKMTTESRPESDVALHLAQGLVTLRRQHAEKALSAKPERLKEMASAFLANLQALQERGVSACYGFISKGETSPAIVQLMQNPETAKEFNAHVKAIFDAISEGEKTPTKHEAAVKGDYDILIKELGKIGWKESDLQTFSNPRLLAKQPPELVCKMVIDWFVAHLAVTDGDVQERLLYETLKPVVTG